MAIVTPSPAPSRLLSSGQSVAERLRSLLLGMVAPVLGRVLYRLCLGRWPNGEDARIFATALRDRATKLPPCCRAMLEVPAGQGLLGQMLLVDMFRRGMISPTDALDVSVPSFHAPGVQFNRRSVPADLPAQSGNPLAFWTGPPIAFLHLEKTAGISLSTLLTQLFHPAQIDPDPRRTVAPHLAPPFAGRPETSIRRHALIYGHYDLPSLRRLDASRIVVTLLRDPVERILSLYYYWRSINLAALLGAPSYPAVEMAHHCTLLAFLEADTPVLRDHIDNFYVRRLTGLYGTGARSDKLEDAPEIALRAALRGLRQIDFVGVTERMSDSVEGLAAFLGFTPPAAIPRENAAATNPALDGGVFTAVAREALTPAHWRHLARLTRLDSVVYRAACERLAQHGGRSPHRHGAGLARAPATLYTPTYAGVA